MTESKPVVLKVVKTDGGFAVYAKSQSIHPTAVVTGRWEVMDLVAEWLAGFDGYSSGATVKAPGR